jgi:hypothetical protein
VIIAKRLPSKWLRRTEVGSELWTSGVFKTMEWDILITGSLLDNARLKRHLLIFLEPDISALKNEEGSSIDGKSIAIGFVIGVVLTILAVVAFWFFVSRIYHKKQKSKF